MESIVFFDDSEDPEILDLMFVMCFLKIESFWDCWLDASVTCDHCAKDALTVSAADNYVEQKIELSADGWIVRSVTSPFRVCQDFL